MLYYVDYRAITLNTTYTNQQKEENFSISKHIKSI